MEFSHFEVYIIDTFDTFVERVQTLKVFGTNVPVAVPRFRVETFDSKVSKQRP